MIVRVFDDRKRELTFGTPPKRIVSLVPSDTYSVAALGCAGALVGRTDYCDLPEDIVRRVPSVGGTKNPKLEAIFRKYVGRNQAVISRPISRSVTPDEH